MKRADALKIAKQLFKKHKLDKRGWTFGFDRAIERQGLCLFLDKRITISGPLVDRNDEAWVRELLLHEIAHALAGQYAGHGPRWKAVCRRIGAIPQPYGGIPPGSIPPKYILTCPGCDTTFRRQRVQKGCWCPDCGREKGLLLVALNPDFKEPGKSPRVA